MIEPPVIDIRPQLGANDCVVRVLAWFLGLSYEKVLTAKPKKIDLMEEGIGTRQMVDMCKRLGFEVRSSSKPPDEDVFCVLDLYKKVKRKYEGHVALQLRGGYVVDPSDGLLYQDMETLTERKGWLVDGYWWRES